MSELDEVEACEIIRKLRSKNGGLSAKQRKLLVDNDATILEGIHSLRRQLADSIKIVVDNLYSTETRFVYELIQNAEDNSYCKAIEKAQKPFLTFRVFPDRIIVESNEDGFSRDNVIAICSVGKSTKKQSAGYIGEKGIGFKCVFKIAKKVQIQSGSFSFAFLHTQDDDDDGLGMITPYDEDREELAEGVRTRMTLTLLDPTKFEERSREFQEIPDTFLMFLGKLQRLTIELCPRNEVSTVVNYSKREVTGDGLYTTFLTKTTRYGSIELNTEQKYYTMKNILNDLPFDEARTDKDGKSIHQAAVVLGFPLDERDEPILEPQFTYAFLPLRRVGFKFLIQSDFITQANREDVTHCKRNQAVLKGVAEGFVNAIIAFCQRPSLRYNWMRYLPEDSITDDFWRTLWDILREKLSQTPLLESWSGVGLYKPCDLRRLSKNCIANDGTPLLPDLEGAETYLSPKYTEADFTILKRLGAKPLTWSIFVDRLDADLLKTDKSKWRDMENDATWRTQICNILLKAFNDEERSKSNEQERLRSLPLIPLMNGKWVSSASYPAVYFHQTDGVSIPVDLWIIDLIHPSTAENVAWNTLLQYLGVKTCASSTVIGVIHTRYLIKDFDSFNVVNGAAHIRYLYWFLPKDDEKLPSEIQLANQHGSLLKRDQYLYFPDEVDDYSPAKLFKQDEHLPGHPVHYLHGQYLTAVASEIVHNGRSWRQWLEEVAGVCRLPVLCAQGSDKLSKDFKYIIKFRSDELLKILKRGWRVYHPIIAMTDSVKGDLHDSDVLLENGSKTWLSNTFLPLPKLKLITEELHITDGFQFIAMSEPIEDHDLVNWTFVKELAIGIEDDLQFYDFVLDAFKELNPCNISESAASHLQEIYRKIQSTCIGDLEYVRGMFEQPIIWIEALNGAGSGWISASECVWNGPQWLKSKQCLNSCAFQDLEHLFKVSLKIPDASEVHVLDDLNMLMDFNDAKKNTSSSQSLAHKSKPFTGLDSDDIIKEAEKRYHYLWQVSTNTSDDERFERREAVRLKFEAWGLVYIPKANAWMPPSRCVWVESNVKIPERASIATVYRSKKTFFTKTLRVSEPTVAMYVESLKAEVRGTASTVELKEIMTLICGLSIADLNFSSLIEIKVFPVKLASGECRLASVSREELGQFAILDTMAHRQAFEGKISILDFSLEEIRDTRPFLLAMGLGNRLSSEIVEEVTDVIGGYKTLEMTKNLRAKSKAIIRCASHFTSLANRQELSSLYSLFQGAEVHLSDGIGLSLNITQNGRSIRATSSGANFHLESKEGILRLYLPKDEVERDVCLESDLPRRLCVFLGLTDKGAPGVIGGVFRKDNLNVIDRILEKAGIGQVEGDFTAPDDEPGQAPNGSIVEPSVETTSHVRFPTPTPSLLASSSCDGMKSSVGRSESAQTGDVPDLIIPSSSYVGSQVERSEAAYRSILENVVDVARPRARSGVLDTSFSFQGPQGVKALSSETIRDAFGVRTQESDFKRGAAGELYMFEYLKGLNMPDFTLGSWKSAIRDRVKTHQDYRDIEKDNDRKAIADIQFADSSHKFTQLLIRKGHLARELWDNETPFYYIEVKTTTSSDWQEPFFMSKAQENHIQNKRIENGRNCQSVYIICRVFDLGKGAETGMHIYLDPETKRRNGNLEFSTHTWAVRPLSHPLMITPDSELSSTSLPHAPGASTPRNAASTVGTDGDTRVDDSLDKPIVTEAAHVGSFGLPTVRSPKYPDPTNIIKHTTNGPSVSQPGFLSASVPETTNLGGGSRAASAGSIFGSTVSNLSASEAQKPVSSASSLFGSHLSASGNGGSKEPHSGSTFRGFGASLFDETLSNPTSDSSSGFSTIAPRNGSLFGSSAASSKERSPFGSSTSTFFGGTTFGSKTTSSGQGNTFSGKTLPSDSSGPPSDKDSSSKSGSTVGSSAASVSKGNLSGRDTKSSGFGGFGSQSTSSLATPQESSAFGTQSEALPSNNSKSPSSSSPFAPKAQSVSAPAFETAPQRSLFETGKPVPPSAGGGQFNKTANATSALMPNAPKSLFGTASSSAPLTTGGLFGANTNTTPFSKANPPSSLFGATSSSAASTASGIFGANSNNTPISKADPPISLFGTATSSAPSTTGGLFGPNPKFKFPEPSTGIYGFGTYKPSGAFGAPSSATVGSVATNAASFSGVDFSKGASDPRNPFKASNASSSHAPRKKAIVRLPPKTTTNPAFDSSSVKEPAPSSDPTASNKSPFSSPAPAPKSKPGSPQATAKEDSNNSPQLDGG